VGGWRRQSNKEIYNLYNSNNIRLIKSRSMRWVEHIPCMGEMRHAYKILVSEPEGKRQLGRPRHREEHNIRIDLREIQSK
jgi:hypothetical protein